MSNWQPPARGALDDTPWPDHLIARAARRTGGDDQLHGYAVLSDVARHFRHSDLMYLAIVGELPDERASAVFHVALCSLSVVTVNEAPCHTGVLSRICGGALASAFGASMIALADATRATVARNAALLTWLANPTTTFSCAEPDEPAVAAIQAALASHGVALPTLLPSLDREAAQIALLYEAGIRTSEHLEAAIVIAKTSGLTAELLATGPQHLRDYPVKLPPFHYVEGP